MRVGKKQFLIKKFVRQIEKCSYLMVVYTGEMSNSEFQVFSQSIYSEGFKVSQLKNSLVAEAIKLHFSKVSNKYLSIFINSLKGNVCLVYPVSNGAVYTIPTIIQDKNKAILLSSLYVLKSDSVIIMNQWTSFKFFSFFSKNKDLVYLDFFSSLNSASTFVGVLNHHLRLLTMISK